MNMMITSAPAGTSGPAGTAPAAAGKAANGGGFATALVQAIEGNDPGLPATGGALTLPIAFTALLGQVGDAADDAQTSNPLLQLLAQLTQNLQSQDEDSSQPSDPNDPLQQLLAALQALLSPLQQTLPTEQAQDDSATATETIAAANNGGAGAGQAVAQALQAMLAQAAASLTDGRASAGAATQQPLLQAIVQAQQALAQAAAGADAAQNRQADAVGALAEAQSPSGATKLADALQQLPIQQVVVASAQSESKRPASVFKEPVLHWNLAVESNAGSQATDATVVQASTEGSQAGDSGNQGTTFAWTLAAQDQFRTANTDGARASLPAQVPVQQFSQQVGNYLVRQFALSGGNGVTEARLSLTPEHLGKVDIRISMQDGQLTAQFVAHSGAAKELIENQMGLLRTSLQGHGIQVERMEVVQQQAGLSDTASFQSHEQRQSDSEQQGRSSRRGADDAAEQLDFEAEMERSTSLRDIGFGGAINVTA